MIKTFHVDIYDTMEARKDISLVHWETTDMVKYQDMLSVILVGSLHADLRIVISTTTELTGRCDSCHQNERKEGSSFCVSCLPG